MADSIWESAKAAASALGGMRGKGKSLWADADREAGTTHRPGLPGKGFTPAEINALRRKSGGHE